MMDSDWFIGMCKAQNIVQLFVLNATFSVYVIDQYSIALLALKDLIFHHYDKSAIIFV